MIPAAEVGYYLSEGGRSGFDMNYLVRRSGSEYRNFLVFELPTDLPTIRAGTLRLFNPGAPPATLDGYMSHDPFEAYSVFDVTTDIQSLVSGSGGVAAFDDLGSGVLFGFTNVTPSHNGSFVEVSLNLNGLAALNQADGTIAFGGAVTSFREIQLGNETIFGFSHEFPDVQLHLELVPEPDSCRVLLIACAGLLAVQSIRLRF